MSFNFLKKIFKDNNEKYLEKITPLVKKINFLEKEFSSLSQEKIREKISLIREKIANGESLDNFLIEVFALVREASKRTLSQRHYDVQLLGGIALHQGRIVEMKTGEGKTLVATLPLTLNALEGKGAHLVTVNDYLARRDTVWMGQIYHFLGLTVGCLNHERSFIYDPNYKQPEEEKEKLRDELGNFYVVEDFLRPCSRKEAYLCDIVYGTNNEFGFDYLKDNMVLREEEIVQRDFHYAIIDEADSILIDEARTPLIISAPDRESSLWYKEFNKIIFQLAPDVDYEVDEKRKSVVLTEEGINKIEKILNLKDVYTEKGIRYLHHLEQALKAHTLFQKDRDYVVKDGKIIIIDEFTGRLLPGRRWSEGLHQAIEAKEGLEIQPESITLASISFQNLFRMYKKLAGMTGTALTSAEEFKKVYKLETVAIPTHKPMIRKDLDDVIHKTKKAKLKAIIEEVEKRHKTGQPVLIGTGGFYFSFTQIDSPIIKNREISQLLTQKGIAHQVLDALNHEKEGSIIAQAGRLGAVTVATNMAGRGVDIILGGNPPSEEEAKKIRELGGLFVIGTERNESRRIDNQLRGRSGRQGDPGASQFFLSLEDDLLRIFGGEKIKSLMEKLDLPEDQPIQAKIISKIIEEAQLKIEGINFDLRKSLLEYDDVMNKQREAIYKKRREILTSKEEEFKKIILKMAEERGIKTELILKQEEKIGKENFFHIGKIIALKTIDFFWIDHLEQMEHLRQSVQLRAYGQKDPLVEYKIESSHLFKDLVAKIEEQILEGLLRIEKKPPPLRESSKAAVIFEGKKKPKRNDPCPCGSGKKYKKCCGK